MALRLLPAEGLELLPVLDLRLGFNRGVSFGFLAGDGIVARVGLVALPVAAIIILSALVLGSESAIERIAYALMSGGAFGNLADRLPDGLVTDFIEAHAAGWHSNLQPRRCGDHDGRGPESLFVGSAAPGARCHTIGS